METGDLFYDIAGDPDLLVHTPFDAVYFPAENQEHVDICAQNAGWILTEIEGGFSAVRADGPATASAAFVEVMGPSPLVHATRLRFAVPWTGSARVAVYDVSGREVRRLEDRLFSTGGWETTWDGHDGKGRWCEAGVYFVQLRGRGFAAAQTLVVR